MSILSGTVINRAGRLTKRAAVITTLIADDELDVLALLRMVITSGGADISVSAEAHDGLEAMEQWRLTRPSVVILDQRMPRLTGLEAAEQILDEAPNQAIMLLSAYLNDSEIARAGVLGLSVMSKQDIMQIPAMLRRIALG